MIKTLSHRWVELSVAVASIVVMMLFPSYMLGELTSPWEFLATFWFVPALSFAGYIFALWVLKRFIKTNFWRHIVAFALGYWFFLWSLCALATGSFRIWG